MMKSNMPTAKRLVVCADDYGMTPEVSAGILALARTASISATSVMSLSPTWPDWAAPLKEVHGHVDVGLHLDFTSHLSVQQGMGAALPAVMLKTLLRLWHQPSVQAHIELQLAHSDRDGVSAAYNFATYLPKRAKMMQDWANYLDGIKAGADVINLKRASYKYAFFGS